MEAFRTLFDERFWPSHTHRSCACFAQRRPPCVGTKFQSIEGATPMCRDYQELKIQESMQTLEKGSIPRSIVVVLEDDLVDTVKAGGKGWLRLDANILR